MTDKIILGKNIEYSSDTSKTMLNNNICLIGCTGSGKTLNYIQPLLLNTHSRNLIINDPKRELFSKYKKLFEGRGYNVQELNLVEPKESDVCFDPLKYVASDNDVTTLARSIVNLCPQGPNSHADRYWEDSAANLCAFGLYYTLSNNGDSKFSDFLKFIDDLKIYESNVLMSTNVDGFMEELKEKYPNHPMIPFYNAFSCTPIRTAGSIFTTLKTTLANVFNYELKDMLRDKANFNVSEFAIDKSVLFITSNGSNEYVDSYVNLIFDTIIKELIKIADKTSCGKLPIETHLIMDDFACGTKLANYPKQISVFRSKGISSTIVLQSESQLSDMYGDYAAHTILNNNDTVVYLGGNDVDTADDISKRLNVGIEDVLYMPLNQTIIFRRGQKPIVAEKYPTLEDERFIKFILKTYKGDQMNEK